MAIFTSLAVASFLGIGASFFTGVIAFGLNAAIGIGISLAAKALSGASNKPTAAEADHFSAQGKLQSGGDVPRSFQLGYSVTAGSLVYANEWGQDGKTPNAYHTQVIALQDLPGGSLVEFWVNGELSTLTATPPTKNDNPLESGVINAAMGAAAAAGLKIFSRAFQEYVSNYIATHGGTLAADYGLPVLDYRKNGKDHLWVKFYDGTQTTADSFLVNKVASADRPYESTRVGVGITYVIVTALVEDTLFTGFPTYKFALSGIPLYDITKDSTMGGSGSHRWSDKATWGGDGDQLPAVQLYNLLRGVTFNGQWLYGLQQMTGARLPSSNWRAQVAKCRDQIMGESGFEPTYRSGGQISVDAQIANAVEALLTTCQGRLSEIGGFYKVHLGAPDSSSFLFTDDDILSTEDQTYHPFFALSDSINGIAAKYPLPAEGWNTKVAPPIYRADLEEKDGGRRLLANPSFDFVPYSAQVQRLMSSALEEAQRARTHSLSLPPAYWIIEPGDVGAWTSARNGYDGKLFRVDGVVDRANLDVGASLTEVDPSDYDWDHGADFEPVNIGPTVFERPSPQAIRDWDAQPDSVRDDDGFSRRPAIRLSWDGDMPSVSGVQYEIRLVSSLVVVARGRTDRVEIGELLITQSLLPDTLYQARGAYIPSSPRDVEWSDWISVTTLDVRLSERDLAEAIAYQVTQAFNSIQDRVADAESIIDLLANEVARNRLDKTGLRGQVWDIRKDVIDQIEVGLDAANASIESVQTVAVTTQSALAAYQVTVTAQFGAVNSNVSTESIARASADSALSATVTSLTSTVNSNSAAITAEQVTRANADSALSASISTVSTTVGGHTASLQLVASSVNGNSVMLGLIGTIDGVTGGLVLSGVGQNGVVSYNLYLRGDFIVDGTITGAKIQAGSISASRITAGSISTTQIAVGGVDLVNLIDGAASSMASNSGTAGSGEICNTVINVKGGRLIVWANFISAGAANNIDGTIHLDGVQQRIASSFSPNGATVPPSPIQLQLALTGVSDGNHTVSIRTVSGNSVNGSVIAFNPRK